MDTLKYQRADTSDDDFVAQWVSESLDADVRTILNDGGHAELVEDESTDDTGPLTVIGGMLAAEPTRSVAREILEPLANSPRTNWHALAGWIMNPEKAS